MKRAALLTLALVLAAIAVPAGAKNWVTLDYQLGRGGQWLDRDTLRRDGDLVYFEASARLGNRVYPDDRTPGITQAYNCRTKTLHRVRDGALDRGRTLAGSAAIPYESSFAADSERSRRRRRLISSAGASICALIPHAGPSYRCSDSPVLGPAEA